jgi:hypothetical protein
VTQRTREYNQELESIIQPGCGISNALRPRQLVPAKTGYMYMVRVYMLLLLTAGCCKHTTRTFPLRINLSFSTRPPRFTSRKKKKTASPIHRPPKEHLTWAWPDPSLAESKRRCF